MFDRIAPVYDLMNRVMTAGLDRRWRRLAVREVVWPGDRVLDSCCGTGDLAVEAERRGGRVVGLDFSERMLERARRKSGTIEWVQGDALALPFDDGEFDAVTCGFGVRNLADLEGGLREAARVLRPGGKIAVLEITRPRGLLRPFFRLWFDVLVPLAGKVLPGGKAYTYLPASVRRFPGPEDLAALFVRPGSRTCASSCSAAAASPSTWRSGRRERPGRPPGGRAVPRRARAARSSRRSSTARDWSPRSVGTPSPRAGSDFVRSSSTSPRSDRERALRAGVAIELAHVATLVHDDLIDGAELRRGRSSAWHEHGARAARSGRRLPLRPRDGRARRRGRSRRRRHPRARVPRDRARRGDAAAAAARPGHADRRLPRAHLAEDGKALRGRVPARLPRPAARRVRPRARRRVPDRRRHPRLRRRHDRHREDPGRRPSRGRPTLPLDPRRARGRGRARGARGRARSEEALVRVAATGALERSRAMALDYARKAREFLRDEPDLEALTHIVIDRER